MKEIVATQSPASSRQFLIYTLANISPPHNTLPSLILQSESVMELWIVGKE